MRQLRFVEGDAVLRSRSSADRQPEAEVFVQPPSQSMLLQFVKDISTAGEIADEDSLAIAHSFRYDMFIGSRFF